MAFEEALSIIEHKEPDWERLYSLADRHAVKPQLANLLGVIACLLYTSDAADDLPCVDLGGRRIIQQHK